MELFNSLILSGGVSLFASVSGLILFLILYLKYRYADFPPGPWGLPVLGYLPFFSREPHKDFVRFSKKYGDIFSVNIGARSVVIMNDYETIKETSMKEIYSGKPVDGRAAKFGDYKNVFVTDGPLWREQRRFLLNSLRDFGFGKKKMEEYICEEAKLIIEEFLKNKGKPTEVQDLIYYAVMNIVCYLNFAERFDYNDKGLIEHLKYYREALIGQSHFSIFDAFPKLEYFLSMFGVDPYAQLKMKVYSFIDQKIQEHKKTFDANNIRDIIDTYILKQTQCNGNSSDISIFTDDYIRTNVMLLFSDGTETTASTLRWALKLLALNPHIQHRVQEEIDSVIGRERSPTMNDKLQMPFTTATLLEIERVVSLLPLTMYHRVTEDTVLKGYKIPKDTFILSNLWYVHNDPKIWENPSEFNPSRFLDREGKISTLRDYVIPFSVGKRNCLGESLARIEIFLYLTLFLQKLTFIANEDRTLETVAEIPLRTLTSCCLSIVPRN